MSDSKSFAAGDKVNGTLVGVDSNAFCLLGKFKQLARRQGFSKEEIETVTEKAKSGDYNNLVYTLDSNMSEE